jgi:hypothetical protein
VIDVLTREELIKLTDRKQPAKIAAQLAAQGFSFTWGADGYPKLDRQHYLSLMNPSSGGSRRRREPNFDAVRRSR